MAEYKIECEQFLGFSHSGSVYTSGESTVELSDEEVATLVQLMREKNTTGGKERLISAKEYSSLTILTLMKKPSEISWFTK